MAKVLLILPHLPQRMGAPYLGQQYIAASLLADGHAVKCLDHAAVRFEGDDDDAVRVAEAWQPDIIGMTLFTLNAERGYQLARALRHTTALLLAGGPHATILPREPVDNGFDAAVSGEGELAARALARHVDAGTDWRGTPGVWHAGGAGPPAGFIDDLDALAFPLASYPCYDPLLYSLDGLVVPGGMMTSRGCPARCTFCANYVTGRGYRWRSTGNILAEMRALSTQHGVRHFPFWDDAFTARRPRLNELCDGILADSALRGVTWTCITPGVMVKPHDLVRMREAGCVAVNFGIESGDFDVLKAIKKGQRPEHVVAAVEAARDAGMMTIVNFMFGFPDEGVAQLANTLALMERLAPHTDFFNNRGVLVPFPGTDIYDRNHERFGFTEWWRDPAKVPDEPNLHVLDPSHVQKHLEEDPTLALDFFRYTDEVRDMIAACVRFKAQHNQRSIARMGAKNRAA